MTQLRVFMFLFRFSFVLLRNVLPVSILFSEILPCQSRSSSFLTRADAISVARSPCVSWLAWSTSSKPCAHSRRLSPRASWIVTEACRANTRSKRNSVRSASHTRFIVIIISVEMSEFLFFRRIKKAAPALLLFSMRHLETN
jgi:hypothetical protein